MPRTAYIAFDLGAESGRAMLATLSNDRVTLDELHRFPNTPCRLPSGLHWDLLGLWGNLLEGLSRCAAEAKKRKLRIVSLGVDTWGVDFGLIGESGQLLGLPFCYRDGRHPPAMRRALCQVPATELYRATGIQLLPFNSLFQLVAQQNEEPQTLAAAKRMLMIPDLLHYFFTGRMVNEATNASTTQMVDPRTGRWNRGLMKTLGVPTRMLGPIVPAGARIGSLRPELARDLGIDPIDVITPGSHDTASAIAAVPLSPDTGDDWAYISSGTWSLMGAELDRPLLSDAARKAGFTNERGVGGNIRFLKNLAGLWLVQECRRDFARRGSDMDYATLTRLAEKAAPFRTLIDTDHPPFLSPGDMPAKITALARKTRQPAPRSPGEFVRCCLESLALTYRRCLVDLERLLGKRLSVLHIVGGGGRNKLLNQMTADAIGRPVIVGPYEATAVGNALTQAIGAGRVRDLSHLRGIVAASYRPEIYRPRDTKAFDAQVARAERLRNP